jgi:hypothetical protein
VLQGTISSLTIQLNVIKYFISRLCDLNTTAKWTRNVW